MTTRASQWRPDFIYQRYSLFNYAGPSLRHHLRVPLICEYNGPLAWIQRNWEGRRLLWEGLAERIERLNLCSADLVVVVSDALRDEALARGVSEDRILVNPNGVDTDRYAPAVDGSAVRSRYGLGDAVVVGFIGTIGPWHGVEELVSAAALLPADSPIRFLVIGDGVRMNAVREQIARHSLEGRVVLTGLVPQHDGPAHLAACDVFASPHVPNPDGSRFFGSPTKLFEYMAMGRPIVASDLEQIGELLEHDSTAWLVPPGDPAALAEAIVHLATRPELRERLGAAARNAAVSRHTWLAHSRCILDACRTGAAA